MTAKPAFPEDEEPVAGAGLAGGAATLEVGAAGAGTLDAGTGAAAVGASACCVVGKSEGSTIGPLPGLPQMVEAGSGTGATGAGAVSALAEGTAEGLCPPLPPPGRNVMLTGTDADAPV